MTNIWAHRQGILLICALFWLAGPVGAQSAVQSNGQGSVTIDASRLDGVIALDAPWRFHAGNDVRFAEPNFDDSTWPLVQPGEDRRLADSHVPNVPDGQSWARLHVHIVNFSGPLAIKLALRSDQPYVVFANGKQIGATDDFPSRVKGYAHAFAPTLPQTSDIELAVRLSYPGGGVIHYFPLERITIGQNRLVWNEIDLARYQTFEGKTLSKIINASIYFACIPASLFLLWAQKRHYEYLWLAIFCFSMALTALGNAPTFLFTLFPAGFPAYKALAFIDPMSLIACSEFVAVLGGVRIGRMVRLVQALSFLPPLLVVFDIDYNLMVVEPFLWTGVVAYLLVAAYVRGSKECGILFFPLTLQTGTALVATTQNMFPKQFGRMARFHLGGMGYTAYDIGSLFFLAGIIAVVLYRFVRVSREEEIAAAELEAARTVQQLLLPAIAPVTPGFSVESAYLPARQVGGDFFLVLPALEEFGDESLLAIMGDVSGKGLQAAMVVSTIIGGLRMQLSRQPGEVLAHLNRMLTGHVSGFATCCAVLIEADADRECGQSGSVYWRRRSSDVAGAAARAGL